MSFGFYGAMKEEQKEIVGIIAGALALVVMFVALNLV